MAGWYGARKLNRSTKAVIAMTVLAVALAAAVPLALVVALVMMLLGHVVGGLALFGGSILAAVAAGVLAGLTGMRYVRRLVAGRGFRVVSLGSDDYTLIR